MSLVGALGTLSTYTQKVLHTCSAASETGKKEQEAVLNIHLASNRCWMLVEGKAVSEAYQSVSCATHALQTRNAPH
jgi:hypothetical protein